MYIRSTNISVSCIHIIENQLSDTSDDPTHRKCGPTQYKHSTYTNLLFNLKDTMFISVQLTEVKTGAITLDKPNRTITCFRSEEKAKNT